jgi:Domain of unknown function (DUF4345)
LISLLRAFAAVFFIVGMMHISMGVYAEASLGAGLSAEALTNATLDSQNRFYGAEFMIYGVLIWLFTTDMERYATVFRAVMIVFFIGGLARTFSAIALGMPAPAVQLLWATELIIPPLLLLWQARRGV